MLESSIESGIFESQLLGKMANPGHWLHFQVGNFQCVATSGRENNSPQLLISDSKTRHNSRSKKRQKQTGFRLEKPDMKPRFSLFNRAGVYYSEDSTTGKQQSLRTKDKSEAVRLMNGKNEAERHPRDLRFKQELRVPFPFHYYQLSVKPSD